MTEKWDDTNVVQVRIKLNSCDSATYFEMDMDAAELDLARRMTKKSCEASTFGCMPNMVLGIRHRDGDLDDDSNFTEVAL